MEAQGIVAEAVGIKDVPHIVWDDAGDNPYFAFLALADPSSRLRIR
jgi:mitochondrial fission protein ELM1